MRLRGRPGPNSTKRLVRAWMEYKSIQDAGNDFPYRWPLFFIIASSFWNFLGAGVFGFLINLPVINYYEHGTYLTANHGHAALFGVYGMLSIATILFSWRSMVKNEHWSNGTLKLIFFGMNLGLLAMTLGTLLPVGISQLLASYNTGLWFARSGDFYNTPLVQTLGQLRILPDTIIICLGAIPLFLFLVTTYPRLKPVGFVEGESLFKDKEGIL